MKFFLADNVVKYVAKNVGYLECVLKNTVHIYLSQLVEDITY